MLKVMDVLKSKDDNIWSITSQETAYKALEIMADKDIGVLLVIDEGQLIGIFSERDYARKVILKGKSSRETTVGELMTTPVFSISQDKSIEECMALMTAVRSRHMPVMEVGKLVGLVTIGDVVSMTIAKQKIEINDLKNYVTGGYSNE
jgi:CBS domain-containing protein